MCAENKTTEYVAILPVEYVMEKLQKAQTNIIEVDDNIRVRVKTNRMNAILKGTTCVSCGAKPLYFTIEKYIIESKIYKLELYVERPDGYIDRITADHIKPRAKGGTDDIENLQPMCYKCNCEKGATYEL